MKTVILAGAALAALCLSTAPAMAQDVGAQDAGPTWPITGYGSLGYTLRTDGAHLGALTGRLGLRYGRFIGAEAEGSFGIAYHDYTLPNGQPYDQQWSHSVAAYAVGYIPVMPRLDLFGRVGLGSTRLETTVLTQVSDQQRDSLNYGGGAQYFFTRHDGIRADYTVEDYRNAPGHADVWNLSWVHRF